MVYVQFKDETESEICSVFGCRQDPDHHENLGEVERDDDRLIQYWASLPEEILRY